MAFNKIETSRTLLRQLSLNDVDDIFRMYSDAESMQYRETAVLLSMVDADHLLRKYLNDVETGVSMRWGIELKSNRQLIGMVVWKLQHPENEFGYSLDKNYWRMGLMSEILKEVIRHLLIDKKLDFITARIMTGNIASQKLLLKLGFTLTGTDEKMQRYRLTNQAFLSRSTV